MSRSTRWILTAVFAGLLFLLARFPASVPARLLPSSIALAGVEGSIWKGGATALGINGLVAQEKISWRFEPLAIFKGQIAWQLHSEHAGQPGQLRAVLGLRGAALEGIHLILPLEPLTQFDPVMTAVRLRGEALLESTRIARHEPIEISGNLQRIGSAMAGELTSVGSYHFTASASAQGAGTLAVTTLNGPLQIQGGGSFDAATKKAKFSLRLKPETDLPGLSPILATLPRDGDSYLLNYPR
jgi:hypothetical protein